MNSKEEILSKIRKNKGSQVAHPTHTPFEQPEKNLVKTFEESLKNNAGSFQKIENQDAISSFIKSQFPAAKNIISLVESVEGTQSISEFKSPQELKDIDLAIIQGQFGVAENAAIWLPESTLIFRALPFITQHLVILLDKDDLVPTMQEAYQRINLKKEGYGVFIAGPSKTADIEQNLVIGAHGSRSLMVFVV